MQGHQRQAGEWPVVSKAYIIEVGSHTAGIVAKEERNYCFFSSDHIFDRLDGQEFRSVRDAERAVRALLKGYRGRGAGETLIAL